MTRIDLDEVAKAYAETGAEPTEARWFEPGVTSECCVLGVLLLKRLGGEALHAERLGKRDELAAAAFAAKALDLDPDYTLGVVDGFDETARYMDPERVAYAEGVIDGTAARARFLVAEE